MDPHVRNGIIILMWHDGHFFFGIVLKFRILTRVKKYYFKDAIFLLHRQKCFNFQLIPAFKITIKFYTVLIVTSPLPRDVKKKKTADMWWSFLSKLWSLFWVIRIYYRVGRLPNSGLFRLKMTFSYITTPSRWNFLVWFSQIVSIDG